MFDMSTSISSCSLLIGILATITLAILLTLPLMTANYGTDTQRYDSFDAMTAQATYAINHLADITTLQWSSVAGSIVALPFNPSKAAAEMCTNLRLSALEYPTSMSSLVDFSNGTIASCTRVEQSYLALIGNSSEPTRSGVSFDGFVATVGGAPPGISVPLGSAPISSCDGAENSQMNFSLMNIDVATWVVATRVVSYGSNTCARVSVALNATTAMKDILQTLSWALKLASTSASLVTVTVVAHGTALSISSDGSVGFTFEERGRLRRFVRAPRTWSLWYPAPSMVVASAEVQMSVVAIIVIDICAVCVVGMLGWCGACFLSVRLGRLMKLVEMQVENADMTPPYREAASSLLTSLFQEIRDVAEIVVMLLEKVDSLQKFAPEVPATSEEERVVHPLTVPTPPFALIGSPDPPIPGANSTTRAGHVMTFFGGTMNSISTTYNSSNRSGKFEVTEVNVPRGCTLSILRISVDVERYDLYANVNSEASILRLMEAVISCVRANRGVLEVLSPETILVSFNAHCSVTSHECVAVQTARNIFSSLSTVMQNSVIMAIDTTDAFIITCGAKRRYARVLYGRGLLASRHICELGRQILGRGIIVTERTANAIPEGHHRLAPIDCVIPHMPDGSNSSPTIIYELLDSETIVRDLRYAFIALQRGAFTEAQKMYQAIVYPFAKRRSEVIVELIDKGRREYHRRGQSPFELFQAETRRQLSLQQSVDDEHASELTRPLQRVMPQALSSTVETHGIMEVFSLQASRPASVARQMSPSVSYMGLDAVPLKIVDETLKVTWTRGKKPIGRGSAASVYFALADDGRPAALKIFLHNSSKFQHEQVEAEVNALSRIRHNNVVSVMSCAITDNVVAIVEEWLPGGSLRNLMRQFGRLPYALVRRLTIEIIIGLSQLHEKRMVHCDIKPDNILLTAELHCKLGDFGSCRPHRDDGEEMSIENLRGTPRYIAPEVASGASQPTRASDIWSLGIVVHELLLGELPWTDNIEMGTPKASLNPKSLSQKNDVVFLRMLGRGEVRSYLDVCALRECGNSDEAYQFLATCLAWEPANRSTVQQLLTSAFLLR